MIFNEIGKRNPGVTIYKNKKRPAHRPCSLVLSSNPMLPGMGGGGGGSYLTCYLSSLTCHSGQGWEVSLGGLRPCGRLRPCPSVSWEPFVRRSYICMSTSMTSTDRSLIFSNNLPHCIRLMFCIHITEQNKNFSIKHELKHCIFNSIIYFHLYFKPTVFNLFFFCYVTSFYILMRKMRVRLLYGS